MILRLTIPLAASACMAIAQGAADPAFFTGKLYPALEAARCRMCHARDGVASGTRLHFPDRDATPDEIQTFGRGLARLVDRATPAQSLLLLKPTQRIAHTGGQRIQPGSEEEKALIQWIDFLASSPAPAAPVVSAGSSNPGRLVRRLTHSQYNNTVRDLLGDSTRPALRFPPEDYVDGFKNQLRTQGMPPLLVETYSAAAEKLARNAFRGGDSNGLIPCKPASSADAACRDLFIRSFGLRAFRRPLREKEIQRYGAAFTAQARSGNSFVEGARIVVEAMLQSPNFLFHLEGGPDGKFEDYAAASRLSYFLWDTMPDKALLDAAAKGELRSAEGRERWARKLIESPQAREALDEFFDEWFRLEKVLSAAKDRRRYPDFTPELAAAMVEETRRLLDHLVWDGGNFMEFLTAGYGYLNTDLTALYKLPPAPGEFELVNFPGTSRRAGLLGEASFLVANAGPIETSPTARGIFVREQLLCQHVPPPPPNVNTNLPEATEDRPSTRRQRLSEHVENAACASCHKLMDPIGFGLEGFDAIGRGRTKETILINGADPNRSTPKKFDLPLDTTGQVAGLPNSAFSDSKELGAILAGNPICQQCVVRQIFRYANGRLESAADEETIQSLYAGFRDSGFHFKELLIALATEGKK
jgi:Protein of unknown function (DUF1592)/Protein of unknown function (DUF1588)/Protein of unknown function (DUF1587)/Protein of unknown function (DUF1595)/Protein of unknown function (DUF1585)